MALSGTTRSELDKIIVSLHKRNHPQQGHALCSFRESSRFQANGAHQKINPFGRTKSPSPLGVDVQDVGFGHLDRPQAVDLEWPSALLLRDDPVVAECHFGIEAISQHALIVSDQLIINSHVLKPQAW